MRIHHLPLFAGLLLSALVSPLQLAEADAAPAALPGAGNAPAPPPGADEILARVAKVYRNLGSYSVVLSRRTLVIVRATQDGVAPTTNDYQPVSSQEERLVFRLQRPDNYFLSSATIALTKAGAGTGQLHPLGPDAEGNGAKALPSLKDSDFKSQLAEALLSAPNGWPELLWLAEPGGTTAPPLFNAVVTGTQPWRQEPAYEVGIWLTTDTNLELWISQRTMQVLRSVYFSPVPPPRPATNARSAPRRGTPDPGGYFPGPPRPNRPNQRQLVETIYTQELNPKLAPADFAFAPPAATPEPPEAAGGFGEVHDLLAFAAAHDSWSAAANPPRPGSRGQQRVTAAELAGLVLIEGDKGVGTGFLANIAGHACVVTNLHVLMDNDKITVKSVTGKELAFQGIRGAIGADIALLQLTEPTAGLSLLPVAPDVIKVAALGDQVLVVGNRLGGGVATDVDGKVLGIGPDRIEVDAQFQPGNSGSPVLALDSGLVIGIATFAETRHFDLEHILGGFPGSETRWYAYRLDSVAKWEPIDWNRWQAQNKRVAEFRDDSHALFDFILGDFPAADQNARFQKLIAACEAPVISGPGLPTYRSQMIARLADALPKVQEFATADVAKFSNGDYYDFFHSEPYWEINVSEQVEFRNQLVQALKDLATDVARFQQRVHPTK